MLSPTELELVRRRAGGVRLLADFETRGSAGGNGHGPSERQALAEAARSLAERKVVVPDPSGDPLASSLHPSVAANIEVIARPELLIETRARVGVTQVRAAHGVAGTLGAGLVRIDAGAVELSIFAAPSLGSELIRVVPEAGTGAGARSRSESVVHLETLEQMGGADPWGGQELSFEALEELAVGFEEAAVVGGLARSSTGLLHCLVTRGPSAPDEKTRVGQVVWFATDAGWVGARPEPRAGGERLVRLVPVEGRDIGSWVAPLVAGMLS